MKRFLFSVSTGALLAYFLDPTKGSQRRTSATEKVSGLTGRGGQTPSGTGGGHGWPAATSSVGGSTASGGKSSNVPDNPNPDDTTLKDRVQSELFRDPQFSREEMNINVVDGIVELRGQLASKSMIDSVVKQTQAIPHVKGVHNYLHLAGTPAPNKAEALKAE
jgi:osmotically-inducible protein OsmY